MCRVAHSSAAVASPRSVGAITPLAARLTAAVAAGLLLDLAFPPVGLWWLAPPAAGLLAVACRGGTARRGALLGGLAGLGLFLPLLHWTGAVAGAGAWLALAALEAAFLAALGAALAVVTRLPGWPLWAAALWVGEEALRDRLPFGGFPWGRLAFTAPDPLLPWAAVGGAPLVSFAVAVAGTLLAAATVAVMTSRTGSAAGWVLAVAALGAGAALVPVPRGTTTTTVAVVQGNVPRLGLDFNAQRAAVLADHVAATHQLAGQVRAGTVPAPDLVIWPENSSDIDPFGDAAAAAAISAAVRDIGVPVLVGAVLDGPGDHVRNVGIVWDPVTGPGAQYVKRHPVPFGEYMPFRSLLRSVTSKVDLVPHDFLPGHAPGVLDVGSTVVGDVICFEVAYDGLVRDVVTGGGRLLVVQTNNATFGRSGESSQQLAMGRLRAVEAGRSVLVAATSGISAVIDPTGRVLRQSRIFTRDLLVSRVPLRSGRTLATRVGALPEVALAVLGGAAVLVGLVRR